MFVCVGGTYKLSGHTFNPEWKGQESRELGGLKPPFLHQDPSSCLLQRPRGWSTPLYTYRETETQRVESGHGPHSKLEAEMGLGFWSPGFPLL